MRNPFRRYVPIQIEFHPIATPPPELDWCVVCREYRRFAVLGDGFKFLVCQTCGDGSLIEEAS